MLVSLIHGLQKETELFTGKWLNLAGSGRESAYEYGI
ncbi:rCG43948 [Rattus norvegicus]|uniref:RCG43948 n=1 Tax=Rattus norvegicus TaxID=10116 RepID=A6J7B2_RAT|nr:rCG43948 [Rattus norvegicus]